MRDIEVLPFLQQWPTSRRYRSGNRLHRRDPLGTSGRNGSLPSLALSAEAAAGPLPAHGSNFRLDADPGDDLFQGPVAPFQRKDIGEHDRSMVLRILGSEPLQAELRVPAD